MRTLLLAPAALLAALLLAPPASAATLAGERVLVDEGKGGAYPVLQVTATATAGERNDVTIAKEPTRLRFRDDGAPLRVTGEGCRAIDEHEGICEAISLGRIAIDLGDGDDRVRASDLVTGVLQLGPGADTGTGAMLDGGEGADVLNGARIHGGPGDDVLRPAGAIQRSASGGEGDDRMLGSDAGDTLSGGPGRDELRGGAGDDVLSDDDGAQPAVDLVDGGAGADTVSFRSRATAVTVALAEGTAAEDRLVDVERAQGGSAGDLLRGDEGANVLEGSGGDDRVDGGAGDDELAGDEGADELDGGDGNDALTGVGDADRLAGGDGADRLDGGSGIDALDAGPGDDQVRTVDLVADTATCGAGLDRLTRTRGDTTDRSCERRTARPAESLLDIRARRRGRGLVDAEGGTATITLLCGDDPDCGGTAAITVAGRRVASERFDCRGESGGQCAFGIVDLSLRLPRRLGRRIARRGPVAATVVVTIDPPGRAGTLAMGDRVLLTGRR